MGCSVFRVVWGLSLSSGVGRGPWLGGVGGLSVVGVGLALLRGGVFTSEGLRLPYLRARIFFWFYSFWHWLDWHSVQKKNEGEESA